VQKNSRPPHNALGVVRQACTLAAGLLGSCHPGCAIIASKAAGPSLLPQPAYGAGRSHTKRKQHCLLQLNTSMLQSLVQVLQVGVGEVCCSSFTLHEMCLPACLPAPHLGVPVCHFQAWPQPGNVPLSITQGQAAPHHQGGCQGAVAAGVSPHQLVLPRKNITEQLPAGRQVHHISGLVHSAVCLAHMHPVGHHLYEITADFAIRNKEISLQGP
jgi:hypothetical protein